MDQLVFVLLTLMFVNCTRCDGNLLSTFVMVNGLMMPHFTINYRQYYKQEFITATNLFGNVKCLENIFMIGVTECCLI